MKKILLSSVSIMLSFIGLAQSPLTERIDFSVDNLTVSEALLSLCEKADLTISFDSRWLENTERITFQERNRNVTFLLERCLQNTEVGFKFVDRRLVLYQKPPPIFTISGFLEDSLSGERLVAATVYDQLSGKGTITNEFGFYSLSIPRGKAHLQYAYLGFQSKKFRINIRKNLQFNVPLKAAITLAEVIVTDQRYYLSTGLSMVEAPNYADGTLKQMPTVGGEPDLIRFFQSLPGVQSGSGSLGGTHVRGGETGQNLVLLDGVPVYSISHSLGLFSIFNENMVKSAQLYKGKFPAKYGGRLSSVMDIQTKEGNDKAFHYGASASLVATSVFVEGPIRQDSTSFILSGRRTHLDPLFGEIPAEEFDPATRSRLGYYFYDIHAKINHTLSEKSKIYVSFYKGGDDLRVTNSFAKGENPSPIFPIDSLPSNISLANDFVRINWGNTILSARWNRTWNNQLFSNLTATYSHFSFQLLNTTVQSGQTPTENFTRIEQYNFDSNINDAGLKLDFDYLPSSSHYLKFGGGLLLRAFNPTINYFESESPSLLEYNFQDGLLQMPNTDEQRYFATELNFYLEDNIQFTPRLSAQLGFHNAVFVSNNAAWMSFQPRLSVQYNWEEKGNIYAGYNKMGQFLHVLSPIGFSMPFDLWVPSTQTAPPQTAHQFLVGTQWSLPAHFSFGSEIYYKKLNHLITYDSDLNQILTDASQNFNWENQITSGQGWNYGIETSLKKTKGKTQGYLNYAWSKAERQFAGLSNDQRFPYQFNREHELKLGLQQQFGPIFSLFATWMIGSGQFTTPKIVQVAEDVFEFSVVPDDIALNTFRLPPIHQLNLNFNFHWERPKVNHYLSVGISNVYNHRNPLFAVIVENTDSSNERETKEFFSLPTLPSLRYAIKF
ncbi:MAG: carboxypeptidase-like regulatory domain-containing protein [Bacteroidota bacterium]